MNEAKHGCINYFSKYEMMLYLPISPHALLNETIPHIFHAPRNNFWIIATTTFIKDIDKFSCKILC